MQCYCTCILKPYGVNEIINLCILTTLIHCNRSCDAGYDITGSTTCIRSKLEVLANMAGLRENSLSVCSLVMCRYHFLPPLLTL